MAYVSDTTYLTDCKARLVLLQQAAIETPGGDVPAAFAYATAGQFAYPYWTTQTGAVRIEQKSASGYERREHEFLMRLHVGTLTGDTPGQAEARLDEYIPQVLDYFNNRPLLRRTPQDDKLRYLADGAAITQVEIARYVDEGKPTVLVAVFRLTAPFTVTIQQTF